MQRKIFHIYAAKAESRTYDDPMCPPACIELYNITYERYSVLAESRKKAKELFLEKFSCDAILGILATNINQDSYDPDEIELDNSRLDEDKWSLDDDFNPDLSDAIEAFGDRNVIVNDDAYDSIVSTFSLMDICEVTCDPLKFILSFLRDAYRIQPKDGYKIAGKVMRHYARTAA